MDFVVKHIREETQDTDLWLVLTIANNLTNLSVCFQEKKHGLKNTGPKRTLSTYTRRWEFQELLLAIVDLFSCASSGLDYLRC